MAIRRIQRGAILERTWNSTTPSLPENARRRAASSSNSASESTPVARSSASRDNLSDRSVRSVFSDCLGISEEGRRDPVGVLGPPAEVPLTIPLSTLTIPLNIVSLRGSSGAAVGALLPEDDEDEGEDEDSSS